MSTVAELFSKPGEFERLLADADSGTRTQWDETFVEDLTDRFEQYGDRMVLSTRQLEQLERIANQ